MPAFHNLYAIPSGPAKIPFTFPSRQLQVSLTRNCPNLSICRSLSFWSLPREQTNTPGDPRTQEICFETLSGEGEPTYLKSFRDGKGWREPHKSKQQLRGKLPSLPGHSPQVPASLASAWFVFKVLTLSLCWQMNAFLENEVFPEAGRQSGAEQGCSNSLAPSIHNERERPGVLREPRIQGDDKWGVAGVVTQGFPARSCLDHGLLWRKSHKSGGGAIEIRSLETPSSGSDSHISSLSLRLAPHGDCCK